MNPEHGWEVLAGPVRSILQFRTMFKTMFVPEISSFYSWVNCEA